MKCPLCNNKIIPNFSYDNTTPDFTCVVKVHPDPPANREYNHYFKAHIGNGIYQEEAIVLPFKVVNHYNNSEYRKPRSELYKFMLMDCTAWSGTRYKQWGWAKILDLPAILDILPYKKMQTRLKNIILFS